MSEPVTYKLQLQGSDGKIYIVNFNDSGNVSWLQQKLGICPLKQEISDLKARVGDLEKPVRMKQLLEFLRSQPKPRTRWFIERHFPRYQWQDFSDLKEQGLVVPESHGKLKVYRVV